MEETDNQIDDPSVMFFYNLITNEKIIEMTLKNLLIDNVRMPINKITKQRIDAGHKIAHQVYNHYFHKNEESIDIKQLSFDYDKYIPHIKQCIFDEKNISKYVSEIDIIKRIYDTYCAIIKNKRSSEISNRYARIKESINL
jgi:hypothetical protein